MAQQGRTGLANAGSSWMAIVSVQQGTVTARLYNPQSFNGSRADTRTGRLDLRLDGSALDGLSAPHLALVITTALRDRLLELYPRPEAPAPPDGGHGGEQVEG